MRDFQDDILSEKRLRTELFISTQVEQRFPRQPVDPALDAKWDYPRIFNLMYDLPTFQRP